MNKNIDQIDDFDFGFSFAEDSKNIEQQVNQLETVAAADKQTIDDLQNRLDKLHKSILPLLDNLCRDPDKPSIHWPDRVAKIAAYKKKLKSIVEGK